MTLRPTGLSLILETYCTTNRFVGEGDVVGMLRVPARLRAVMLNALAMTSAKQ